MYHVLLLLIFGKMMFHSISTCPVEFSGRIRQATSPSTRNRQTAGELPPCQAWLGPHVHRKTMGPMGLVGRFIYIKNKQNILRLWIWMINDDDLHLGDAWTKCR